MAGIVFTDITAVDLYRLGLLGEPLDEIAQANLLYSPYRAKPTPSTSLEPQLNTMRSTVSMNWRAFRSNLASTLQKCRSTQNHLPRFSLRNPCELHCFAAGPQWRIREKGVRNHVLSSRLPQGSILRLSSLRSDSPLFADTNLSQTSPSYPLDRNQGDLYVTSPELTFLILAKRLQHEKPPIQLILYGYELCGTYGCFPKRILLRQTSPSQRFAEFTSVKCTLSTIQKLQHFLRDVNVSAQNVSLVHGLPSATRALRAILDAAASPMEAKLALCLTLPCRMGGFGLPKPELNGVVSLPDDLALIAGKTTVRHGGLYRHRKVAYEYDSTIHENICAFTKHHPKQKETKADLGLDVRSVSITQKQIADFDTISALARVLAKQLGVRRQALSPKTIEHMKTVHAKVVRCQSL